MMQSTGSASLPEGEDVASGTEAEADAQTDIEASDARTGLLTGGRAASKRASARVTVGAALALAAVLAIFVFPRSSSRRQLLQVTNTTGGVQELLNVMCTDFGRDCSATKCCKNPGQTCFRKNQYWAACLDHCTPGMVMDNDDHKPWSCEKLGERAKFEPDCSWPGSDCRSTPRCCNRGFQCAVKDQYWAACMQVEQGPWTNNTPVAKIPFPTGWQGQVLGGWRAEYQIFPGSPHIASTSMFCFMAILPGSPEEQLVALSLQRKTSVYGCEENAIFHCEKSTWATWGTGMTTLVNTGTFIKIWEQVKEDGRYLLHDWTVKVDADCVFLPDRLKQHIAALRPPAWTAMYLKNTMGRFTNGGFLGAVEIFSKTAVETFLDNYHDCEKHIGLNSGEDGFLKDCMDALGVGFMEDDLIMHPSGNPQECQMSEFASFHPLKVVDNWIYCYDVAVGNVAKPAFPASALPLLPDELRLKYGR